jgi:hypothetical protein
VRRIEERWTRKIESRGTLRLKKGKNSKFEEKKGT